MPNADSKPEPEPRDSSAEWVPLHAVGSSHAVPTNPDDEPTIISSFRSVPPTDPSLGLTIGSSLGQFEILESVGAGGMAAVLKARDRDLGRVVALKILPPTMAKDGDSITRFKQEARAAAQLDHPNIARVFATGEDRGLHYIAFEFVEGENLRTIIEQRGPLPGGEVVAIAIQVAAGLAHSSARGLVHRDIKPSNIVVTPEGHAKIIDMGLARSLSQSVNGGVTQSGVTLGTFDYISPEQALDPRRADVRSDIYSLGCSLYHALTAKSPVPEGTAARKLHFHQHEKILDPRLLNPKITDETAYILAKMMSKNPADRYQTAQDLILALSQLAKVLNVPSESLPVEASVANGSTTTRILPEPPKVPIFLVGGIVALVVGMILVYSMATGDPARTTVRFPETETPNTKSTLPPELVPAPVSPDVTSITATNLEQLVAALRNPTLTEIRLEPGQRYDFTKLNTGVTCSQKKLVIESRGSLPATIRLPVAPRDAGMLLAFQKPDSVVFRGIAWEFADGPNTDQLDTPDGLTIHEPGRVEFAECRFDAAPSLSMTGMVGIHITASGGTIQFKNSYFGLRRGSAIQVSGRAKIEATECAFAPHPTVFGLNSDSETGGELVLKSCSFLVEKGTVVEVQGAGKWLVSAGHCVFAGPVPEPGAMPMMMMPDGPERRAAILRQASQSTNFSQYQGRASERNAYFRIDPFAIVNRGYNFEECRNLNGITVAQDAGAQELRSPPWATEPSATLVSLKPWEAFRLKTTLAALRVPRSDVVILGAKDLPRAETKLYDPWPPATQDATDSKVKIVYPDAETEYKGDLPRNVYTTLEAAIAEAKGEDVIQIRHDGKLEVPPITIDKPRLRLTLRPFPGTMPILVPSKDHNKVDAALFRLVEGQLTIEGLQAQLPTRAARPGDVRTLSLVSVVAGRDCTLKDCVITLEERENESERIAAISVMDASGEMRSTSTPTPNLTIEQCLIRGRGRVVHIAASRPFDLTLRNTMTAVAGPVLEVKNATRTNSTNIVAHVRLEQVTSILAGPLLDLSPRQPTKPSGWVPVEVTVSRCLWSALEDGPMVRIQVGEADELSRILKWETQRANWYTGFAPTTSWLEQILESSPPKLMNTAAWLKFTSEAAETSLGQVKFNDAPASTRRLNRVEPAHLQVESVEIPLANPGDTGSSWRGLPGT
ncbi:MAG: serine/threonine-protein kinase [Fimbriiglobus sp.]